MALQQVADGLGIGPKVHPAETLLDGQFQACGAAAVHGANDIAAWMQVVRAGYTASCDFKILKQNMYHIVRDR